MSKSLEYRLASIEQFIGSRARQPTPGECDAFMESVFSIAGETIDAEARERLKAEYRDVQSRGSDVRYVPPPNPNDAESAKIRHGAAILERCSPELLSLLADAFDREAARLSKP